MDSLRVALIGYGIGGAYFHAPLINATPGLDLAAVVTRNAERRADIGRRYPSAALLDSPEQAAGYDLAVITTPNREHVPLARAMLDAGVPVVVDKPVAPTVAEARSLAGGPPVFPFHNRRWDGDFRTVQRLPLGEIRRFESRFERWRPEVRQGWKESADPADAGGILYDLGSHLIDQAIMLFGPPDRVYAEVDVRRPGAVAPDDAFLALEHPGGTRSHLWMSAVAADLGPRFRVLGSDASYVVHGMDVQEDQLRAGLTPADEGYGISTNMGTLGTPGDTKPVPTEPGRYLDFYAQVTAALTDGAPPPTTLDDAIAVLAVIEEAMRMCV